MVLYKLEMYGETRVNFLTLMEKVNVRHRMGLLQTGMAYCSKKCNKPHEKFQMYRRLTGTAADSISPSLSPSTTTAIATSAYRTSHGKWDNSRTLRKIAVRTCFLGGAIVCLLLLCFSRDSFDANRSNHDAYMSLPGKPSEPIRIAHAVSLITCHKQSTVIGLLDALMILRHSIHQNSIHRFENEKTAVLSSKRGRNRSNYSYQMYAIVHKDGGCLVHVPLLERLGYIPLVKDTPVNISDIAQPSWYRNHVEGENCCGSKEFIKLYSYTLTNHPIVVHWDLDVVVLRPLDDLFDAMLFPATSTKGRESRKRLAIQKPYYQKLPKRIDAFFTRDITSARPWEKVTAVQGGFLVARPSLENFRIYQQFILQANYTPGRGPGSGWGGLGYGGFQGAMAYQGVLAYFYDVVYPGHSVELDVCRWNQVVADVIWRGRDQFFGQCRDHSEPGVSSAENTPENARCHDCRILPVDETMTAHYTACKKVCITRSYSRRPTDIFLSLFLLL